MDKKERDVGAYVREVQALTEGYTQEVLRENERLRLKVSQAEGIARKSEEQSRLLKSELERQGVAYQALKRQLSEIGAANHTFSEQYVEVEQKNRNLASLYVASFQLHGTLEREEVLGTIQEIIANLIGSEEMGFFLLDPPRKELVLISSVGIDPAAYRNIAMGVGPIGKAAATGETFLAGADREPLRLADGTRINACVPLLLGKEVTGVIAVFGLLQQKPRLEAIDHELLEMLATHASSALYCATLHANGTGKVSVA